MSYSNLSLSRRALSRRGLFAAGGAAALGAVLSACGGSEESSSGKPASSGPWSFTDDRPQQLTADKAPAKIVAFTGAAAALADFGLEKQIVGVFGETKKPDGSLDPQAAGKLDLAKLTVLGETWGQFNLEKYAALQPELLVTHMYDPGDLWYLPAESKDKILGLAPVAAITVSRAPLPKPIQRYADLAASLGADVNSEKVKADKARFEKAAEELGAAAKASGGVKVMACAGSTDIFYISAPKASADLSYFSELGVEFITPEKTTDGDFYESLSWENADKYRADVLLLDKRPNWLQPKDLAPKPTWAALPAVKAGQVFPWDAVPVFSWAGATPLLENLTAAIKKSKKLA